eukprot:2458182-Rhodomonas_salina.2
MYPRAQPSDLAAAQSAPPAPTCPPTSPPGSRPHPTVNCMPRSDKAAVAATRHGHGHEGA